MPTLEKLTIKSVRRVTQHDPIQQRRAKLTDALNEQAKVLAAQLKGEVYQVKSRGWQTNDDGERVSVERMRTVRAWFWEGDDGWYVQCRYGSKVLELGKGNAVYVKTLAEVEGVLEALLIATQNGELDAAIETALSKRKAAK